MKIYEGDGESYSEIYGSEDPRSEYVNQAYTEEGDQVYCSCGFEMWFNEDAGIWQCKDCGNFENRAQWFEHIDAHLIPGPKCLTQCQENYPLCKNWCMLYDIPDDDPIV